MTVTEAQRQCNATEGCFGFSFEQVRLGLFLLHNSLSLSLSLPLSPSLSLSVSDLRLTNITGGRQRQREFVLQALRSNNTQAQVRLGGRSRLRAALVELH